MDFDDATYIATTHTHYWLHSNGSKSTYGEVPRSGHFLFTAPHDTMLEIGGQQFHGRHDTSKLHPIKLTEELSPHLTHEEVDEIEKNFAEMGKQLDELHRMKLRKSIGIDWGFLWRWMEMPGFVLVIFEVAAALVVFCLAYILYAMYCRKTKTCIVQLSL